MTMPCAHTPISTRGPRALAACALAGTLALGLTGCGSSGSSAAASSGGAAGTSTTSASSRYQARLKAAQCLRAHGLNVPDPSANGGGGAGGGAGGGGGGGGGGIRQLLATPAGKAASKSCQSELRQANPFANITPAQRQQFQQAAVKFAQCMRAHNVNIPDPTSNGAGGFGIFRSIPSSERNSPAFRTALKACSSNLPNRGQFGRGGPGGAGGSVGGPGA
jgi:hypothetical protein